MHCCVSVALDHVKNNKTNSPTDKQAQHKTSSFKGRLNYCSAAADQSLFHIATLLNIKQASPSKS